MGKAKLTKQSQADSLRRKLINNEMNQFLISFISGDHVTESSDRSHCVHARQAHVQISRSHLYL